MTPEIITRSFTNDQAIFDEVFFGNKYQIKGNKDKADGGRVIVDIGAHAGFFSFLAISLGARKIYSFEPYIDNFNIMLKNCYNPNFIGRVTPFQVGISPNENSFIGKFDAPALIDSIYFDLAAIGLSVKNDDRFYPCRCEPLDILLVDYCFDSKVDILKIDIGYSEREILLTSKLLTRNVRAVCGEITANEVQLFEFKKDMGIRGFINFFSTPPDINDRIVFRMSQDALSVNFI